MWDTLAITYKGTSQVKRNKLSLLTRKYELFYGRRRRHIKCDWTPPIIFVELPENFFQVHHVLGYALRLDNHVVHIYIDGSPNVLFENSVH